MKSLSRAIERGKMAEILEACSLWIAIEIHCPRWLRTFCARWSASKRLCLVPTIPVISLQRGQNGIGRCICLSSFPSQIQQLHRICSGKNWYLMLWRNPRRLRLTLGAFHHLKEWGSCRQASSHRQSLHPVVLIQHRSDIFWCRGAWRENRRFFVSSDHVCRIQRSHLGKTGCGVSPEAYFYRYPSGKTSSIFATSPLSKALDEHLI